MRVTLNLSAAVILISGVMIGSAMAQPEQATGQGNGAIQAPGGVPGSPYDKAGVAPGSANAPARLSDGTLAETASTTALATSTYNQPTGFLPGMRP